MWTRLGIALPATRTSQTASLRMTADTQSMISTLLLQRMSRRAGSSISYGIACALMFVSLVAHVCIASLVAHACHEAVH